VSVNPDWVTANSEVEVQISIVPFDPDFKFCRFADIIVPATVYLEDETIRCTAPKRSAGRVRLSVSKDRTEFFGNADFTFIAKSDSKGWWIFGGLSIVVIVGFVVLGRQKRIRARRRVPIGLPFKDQTLDGLAVNRRHGAAIV
jgi:hypothetical protein